MRDIHFTKCNKWNVFREMLGTFIQATPAPFNVKLDGLFTHLTMLRTTQRGNGRHIFYIFCMQLSSIDWDLQDMHPQSYFILFRFLQRNVRKAQQVMILSQESTDVPLALFGSFYPLRVGGDGEDSSLKRGKECTLMLKHSKGQVTSTLQSTKLTSSLPHPGPSSSPSKKQRRKTNKKKKLEPLLAYQQRLVEDQGPPPSRLMRC